MGSRNSMRGVFRRPDRRGVSEVVGSVMLLLMTVVVFSGIIILVNSIQGPGSHAFVDLVPLLERTGPDSGLITVTHFGGVSLTAVDTSVIVQVNGSRFVFATSDGLAPSNGKWVTGQKWSYNFPAPTLPSLATITVSVFDSSRNQLLLLSVVQQGLGLGGSWPIIGASQVIPNGFVLNSGGPNSQFGLRVIAADYDNDLPANGVSVNLAQLGCGLTNQTLSPKGFGVFETPINLNVSTCLPVGTYLVNVTARDVAGHTTLGKMSIEVRTTITAPPYITGTGPFGWMFNNQFQAYEIFNSTEWDAHRFNGTPTRNFVKGEIVVIAFASQFMKNADLQNDLAVLGTNQVPAVPTVYGGGTWSTGTQPSSRQAFHFEEFIAGYFLYTARFSTDSSYYGYNGSQLALGKYNLDMIVRANNVDPPQNRFATADAINVTDASGGMPNVPRFEFYSDPALTNLTNQFSFTQTVYAKITVRDTNQGATFGVVTISDYFGGIQIRSPPGNTPVTAVTVKNTTVYTFSIDLSSPNGDAWVFGINAYGVRVTQLIDDNEAYSLAAQLVITGPKWALDIATAIQEWGHPVFGTKVYSVFYQNDADWASYWLEQFDSTPAKKNPDFGGGAFLDIRVGDLDADNDLDAVTGTESGYVFAYRNVNGDGHTWDRSNIDFLGKKVLSVEIGRVDADTYNDVVAGTDDGQIWYYRNDGSWIPLDCVKKHPNKDCPATTSASSPVLVASIAGAKIQDLKLADMNGDGANDLVAALSNNIIRIFYNNGFGVFGSYITTDYTASADSAVQGVVGGTYTRTLASDGSSETITEVNGTGQTLENYQPVAEFPSLFGQIESGSYANAFSADGAPYELISETFTSSGNKWLIANSTSGSNPGMQWAFGTIPALGAGDSATVTVTAFLSAGTEPMEIRYKVGTAAPSAALGQFGETSLTTKTFAMTGFSGGELYIVLQDTDRSDTDGASDGKQTKISIDQVTVTVARAGGTTSRLEHKWQTNTIVAGGSAYRLVMEANHTQNLEQDDFNVQWGPTSSGPWADAFTVNKVVDDNSTQSAVLPTSVGGTQIWVRVTDTNRTANATVLDTFYVDQFFVRRFISVPSTLNITTSNQALEVVIADMNRDGHNDVVGVIGRGANIFYGPAFTTNTRLDVPQDAYSIDVGHIDQNGQLDVVIGSNEQFIYVFYQTNGTYTRTTLVDLSVIKNTQATYIRVGDMDGDGYDDIVIGTKDGDILLYRHLHGTGWDFEQVEQLSKPLFSLDIGDFDRGITFEYSGRLV